MTLPRPILAALEALDERKLVLVALEKPLKAE